MNEHVGIEELTELVRRRGDGGRSLTAIVGAPGSGKSTLSVELANRLNANEPGTAAVLGMDGYHYDDHVLIARGLRARKGAPETFDVDGLGCMLKRLRRNDRDEVAVPVFDRDLEIARAGAAIIPRGVRHVLVEGNYLLLRHEPWSRLAGDFHTTVMMSASPDVLHARLVARWRSYGLSPNEIAAKVDNNDLPNGQTVMTQSTEAEFVFVSEDPMFT